MVPLTAAAFPILEMPASLFRSTLLPSQVHPLYASLMIRAQCSFHAIMTIMTILTKALLALPHLAVLISGVPLPLPQAGGSGSESLQSFSTTSGKSIAFSRKEARLPRNRLRLVLPGPRSGGSELPERTRFTRP